MNDDVIVSLSVVLTALFACALVFSFDLIPLLPVAGVIIASALIFGRNP